MSNYIDDRKLPFKYSVAGVIPINTIIFDWDTQEILAPTLALHIHSMGTGGAVTAEGSCDEVNWVVIPTEQQSSPGTGTVYTTNFGNTIQTIPKAARFIRLRVSTATTGGTTTLSVTKAYAPPRAAYQGQNQTIGAAAHDAASTGNPVRTAGRALTANYTAVASGDTADITTTLVGAQIIKPFSIPEADWQYAAASGGIINTTDVVARAAGAAGIRNYVTGLQLRNTNAVATEFVIKDGASPIWRTQLPASMAGSIDVVFQTPLKGTAATALNIAALITGAQIYANLQGYQAP